MIARWRRRCRGYDRRRAVCNGQGEDARPDAAGRTRQAAYRRWRHCPGLGAACQHSSGGGGLQGTTLPNMESDGSAGGSGHASGVTWSSHLQKSLDSDSEGDARRELVTWLAQAGRCVSAQ